MQSNNLKLSLGSGNKNIDGFKTVDIDPSKNPDFTMDITNLEFENQSIDVIYASHVLEHLENHTSFSHKDFLLKVLCQWQQKIADKGSLFICVPDLEIVSKLLMNNLNKTENINAIIETIYGGNRNLHDHHFFGFTKETLTELLLEAGFINIEKFEPFVDDESTHQIMNQNISLNLLATKRNDAEYSPPDLKSKSNLNLQQIADQRLEEIASLHAAIKELRESKLEAQNIHNKVEKELLDTCQERLDLINNLTAKVNEQHELLMSKRSIISKVIDQVKKPTKNVDSD